MKDMTSILDRGRAFEVVPLRPRLWWLPTKSLWDFYILARGSVSNSYVICRHIGSCSMRDVVVTTTHDLPMSQFKRRRDRWWISFCSLWRWPSLAFALSMSALAKRC